MRNAWLAGRYIQQKRGQHHGTAHKRHRTNQDMVRNLGQRTRIRGESLQHTETRGTRENQPTSPPRKTAIVPRAKRLTKKGMVPRFQNPAKNPVHPRTESMKPSTRITSHSDSLHRLNDTAAKTSLTKFSSLCPSDASVPPPAKHKQFPGIHGVPTGGIHYGLC
jgi:hypothetical protein